MKYGIELTRLMGMGFGVGIVIYDMAENFSPYIYINLGRYAISIGKFYKG